VFFKSNLCQIEKKFTVIYFTEVLNLCDKIFINWISKSVLEYNMFSDINFFRCTSVSWKEESWTQSAIVVFLRNIKCIPSL
jgi:hypothetical protein